MNQPENEAHARIQEFSSGGGGGGVQVSLSKKALTTFFFFFFFFLVLSLFYRSQMVNFKEIYHFSSFQGGPTFSRGEGGPTFSRGGGGPIAYSLYKNHITCDFPGGSGPLAPPPLDPHLKLSALFSLILRGGFSFDFHVI